jgi:hypothetical protein
MRVGVKLVLVSIFLLALSCDTEGDQTFKNYFIKYYGEDGEQEAKDVSVTSDNAIMILGTSTSVRETKRIYIIKTDFEGTILWEKELGSSFDQEIAQDIEPITTGADAGNYAILSNVKKNPEDSLAIRLTVLSPDGDSIRSVLFNQLASQEAKSVTPLSDGGYYITGKTTDTDLSDGGNTALPVTDIEDQLVIKYDNNFTGVQADRIGGSSEGSGVKIFEGVGINYYAGYSDEITTLTGPDPDYEMNFTLRTVSVGGASGTPSGYVGNATDVEQLTSVAKSITSNSYLAIGTQILDGTNINRIYACLLNSDFSNVPGREKDIESDAEGVAVIGSSTGQFLVVGNRIKAGGNRNIWFATINTLLGTTLGPFEFGSLNNDDTASAVAELPNGDIIILGTMNLENQNKIALIKLRSNGQF